MSEDSIRFIDEVVRGLKPSVDEILRNVAQEPIASEGSGMNERAFTNYIIAESKGDYDAAFLYQHEAFGSNTAYHS